MRIVEQSEARFIVEDAPWGLGLFLIGLTLIGLYMVFHGFAIDNEVVSLAALIFAIGAPIAFAKSVRRVQLVLDKTEDQVTLRVRTWRGLNVETWPLDQAARVLVDTRRDDGETRRLLLKLRGRLSPVPLTIYHSSLGDHRAIALKANTFLGLYDDLPDDETL